MTKKKSPGNFGIVGELNAFGDIKIEERDNGRVKVIFASANRGNKYPRREK